MNGTKRIEQVFSTANYKLNILQVTTKKCLKITQAVFIKQKILETKIETVN